MVSAEAMTQKIDPYFPEVRMLLFRIVMCALCLFAVGATVAAAGDKDYKEFYRRGVESNKKGEIDEAIRLYSKAIALKLILQHFSSYAGVPMCRISSMTTLSAISQRRLS
jgi:hypothetical protein